MWKVYREWPGWRLWEQNETIPQTTICVSWVKNVLEYFGFYILANMRILWNPVSSKMVKAKNLNKVISLPYWLNIIVEEKKPYSE